MTSHRLKAELWRLATLTTMNGGKLKSMIGPQESSQALNMASLPSSGIVHWIADLADPHLGPQDHVEADEAILNDIVSRGSGQSSRQTSQKASQGAPLKVLTRPVSSGKDPAAGFTFTKAKSVQQLDFRRPKQNAVNVAAHRGPSPEHHDTSVVKDPFSVPFPHAAPTTMAPTSSHSLTEIAAYQGPSPEHHDTPVVKDPFSVPFPHAAPATMASTSRHSPTEAVAHQGPLPEHNGSRLRKASRNALTSVAGTPKIIKFRRKKTKMGPATDGLPPPYTEDDLLKLLMYHRRQGQQELECSRATQHQKEAEIQQLRDTSNNLSSQLQEFVQCEAQKTAELSKLKANKSVWESKIKRLSDYAKGLANDQKRLREDAEHYQKQRDESLLMAERERSDRLEDQVSRITASHGQLLELFTGHRDTITGKIDDLLHQAQSIVPLQKSSELDSRDPIGPMLEQCVGMLEKLHKADTVKPEDLRKLSDTMDGFVGGYAPFAGRSNPY